MNQSPGMATVIQLFREGAETLAAPTAAFLGVFFFALRVLLVAGFIAAGFAAGFSLALGL